MSALRDWVLNHGEQIARNRLFQWLYFLLSIGKYAYRTSVNRDLYCAARTTLKYERLARSVDGWKPAATLARINSRLIEKIKSEPGRNRLAEAYSRSAEASSYRDEFRHYGAEHEARLRYPREDDKPSRQGDLLVLKPRQTGHEKGVVLIQYNDAFDKFVSIYDPHQVARHYRIVLEPSTWGYCDPAILFFLNIGTEVVVQAQSAGDFDYISSLASNLVPLRLGAGDWVDPDRFAPFPREQKIYDLVMVASWQRIKRHALLFKALGRCRGTVRKVALIGYPSGGRSRTDIESEARRYGVLDILDIHEAVSRSEVSRVVGRSKLGVMLTLREGANKGIYECLFSDVPVIISNRNIGVNRDHINPYTGVAADETQLHETIISTLDQLDTFRAREWAMAHTGYKVANVVLNECLKRCAVGNGEPWTSDIFPKKNDTNSIYVREQDRIAANRAIRHLAESRRS